MAGPSQRRTDRPSRTAVGIAFGIAIAAAVALVAVAVISRSDSSSAPPNPNPVVDLAGIPQSGRVLGNSAAKVMLIEYADPQCPACRLYTEDFFPTLVRQYVRPGKVKTEFRGFPFIGEDSVKGYRFLLAAAEQDKLWNLAEALYRNQGAENSGWVTDDLIRGLASQIPGLDVDKLFADAERADIVQEAEGAEAAGTAAGLQGTPTFVIAVGKKQPYQVQFGSVEQMRAALDDALSN
jgi:protein-disulfide isomerase